MALVIQRWHDIALVQGSADAFVQGSVATDIVPEDGVIQRVTQIIFSLRTGLAALAADAELFWSLTRATKTAVAAFNDDDSLLYDQISFTFTTSGVAAIPGSFRYNDVNGIYLVEPTLYAQFDSTATGFTSSADMRIYYEEVKASEVDILRVLNET